MFSVDDTSGPFYKIFRVYTGPWAKNILTYLLTVHTSSNCTIRLDKATVLRGTSLSVCSYLPSLVNWTHLISNNWNRRKNINVIWSILSRSVLKLQRLHTQTQTHKPASKLTTHTQHTHKKWKASINYCQIWELWSYALLEVEVANSKLNMNNVF